MAEKSPSGRRRRGEQSVLLLPLVIRSCYVAFQEARGQRRRLQNDSMVPRRSGGGAARWKGGRNKSSASNRGRASARFYSRTLNSIAIGFSWLPGSTLSTSLPVPPVSFSRFCPIRRARHPLFVSFCTAPRPPISRSTSAVSYTRKPYYRRHDKIPRGRRRPVARVPVPLWTLTGCSRMARYNEDCAPSSNGNF